MNSLYALNDILTAHAEVVDAKRVAYMQRVRKSAQTLISSQESVPHSLQVCWRCIGNGHLNEALNDITLERLIQRSAYDEATEKLDKFVSPEVSERELLEMEEALRQELSMAEVLHAEYGAVEAELKAVEEENTKFRKTWLTLRNGIQMTQGALESVEVRLASVLAQLEAIPKSTLAMWEDFFKIEDHLTWVSVCGVPLAYDPVSVLETPSPSISTTWQAGDSNAQCISAAITIVSALVGRLTNTLPAPPSDFILDRPWRILTTPTSVESRNANPRITYSLLPFVSGKFQENWHKALKLLADSVSLLFRHWKQPPPHPLPEPGADEAYYILDLKKPSQWNEKMRVLTLNVKQLIALRFPLANPTQTLPSS